MKKSQIAGILFGVAMGVLFSVSLGTVGFVLGASFAPAFFYSALYALPMIHGLFVEYFAWLRR